MTIYNTIFFLFTGLRPFTRVYDFSSNPEPSFVLKTNLDFTPGVSPAYFPRLKDVSAIGFTEL